MPAVSHDPEIVSESGVVRIRVAPGRYRNEGKTIYQARCPCGHKGPRRTSVWEADADCVFHIKHPEETQ